MSLIKCPRCELNYMKDTDELCSVCKREVRGESERFDAVEMCSECGENPVVPGHELCAACLKEFSRQQNHDDENENNGAAVSASAAIEIDSVSEMDEIVPEIEDADMDGMDFGDDEDEEEAEDEE